MNEEENIVGKHSDVEEFIRAAKGSVPATSTDTPNTSAAPHERTFRGPGRMGRPMHVDGGLCSGMLVLAGLSVLDHDYLNKS